MLHLTLAQLEAFYWTAQLGAVHRAAQRLNVAQPTVSLRLRNLQSEIGETLFERHGHGLRLTPKGRDLLGRASLVLEGVRLIGQEEDDEEIHGPLRIGLPEGFAGLYLPAFIDALRTALPSVHPEWVISQSVELQHSLVAQDLDFAVMVDPVDDATLRLLPLGSQDAQWVAGPLWRSDRVVGPADLRKLPIMTNPPPSVMHRKIRDWFASAELEPACLDTCTSVVTIAQLVSRGVALSILPTQLISPLIATGAISIVAAVPQVEPDRVYVGYVAALQTRAIEVSLKVLRNLIDL